MTKQFKVGDLVRPTNSMLSSITGDHSNPERYIQDHLAVVIRQMNNSYFLKLLFLRTGKVLGYHPANIQLYTEEVEESV